MISGGPDLSLLEDMFSESWFQLLQGNASIHVDIITAFCKILEMAQKKVSPTIALLDLGSNLGAINRAALLATDFFLVPLVSDRSVLSLHSLGVAVNRWRSEWQSIHNKSHSLATQRMASALGYVLRLDHSSFNLNDWNKIVFDKYNAPFFELSNTQKEPMRGLLATIRDYRSLVPLSQEAHKPMFDLRPADGALGSYVVLVQRCRRDFENLARILLNACGIA